MPVKNCKLGKNVKIPYPELVNIYECTVGDNSFIGPFVEIQKGVKIGKNCRIQSHTFICEGITIEDNVFISHGVVFINDLVPRVGHKWECKSTLVKEYASIGSNATILPVKIGYKALIGAGSVVTKDIKDFAVIAGNPAKIIRFLSKDDT